MDKSLSKRLIFYVVMIVVALNIVLTIYIKIVLQKNLEEHIISEMKNIKTVVIGIIKYNTLIDEDTEKIFEEISNEVKNAFQCTFVVTKGDKEIYPKKDYQVSLNENEVKIVMTKSKDVESILKLKKIKGDYISTYNYPIYKENDFLGNIILQKKFTNDLNRNRYIVTFIVIGQIVMLMISVIILNHIIENLIKPLRILEVNMEKFGDGEDVSDIEIDSKTEIDRFATRFNEMKNTIIKDRKIKEDFFNNATHELKTPITSISAYVQIFDENNIKSLDEKFLDRANKRILLECKKMQRLICNLLEVSKSRHINLNRKKENISVDNLVTEVLYNLKEKIEENDQGISLNINSLNYYGFKEELIILINNLIDNAIKYSIGNYINIDLKKEKNNIKFSVENETEYIPNDIKDQLLEPFVKYNKVDIKEDNITSSGLGLYICKSIAERNNWGLTYEVKGNKIKFYLVL